ncbi:MAG: hypothetical protein Q8R31_01890 [Candidatus Omnitrophota bacterium]|nr:hypothetical protein [Candidatus Omnitrophota bacterium]
MIAMGLALFLIIVALVVIAIKSPLPIWGKMGFLLFLIVGILLVKAIKGFVPLPIGVRHLIHLIIQPKDLYQPVITDNFLFYEEGFTKTYFLKPKYLDIYEIGFLAEKADISSKYKFEGKLKAEFFWKDKLLFDRIVSSYNAAWSVNGDMEHFKEISLLKFEIPLQGKYKNDISIRLTVLEPDQELKKYADSIKLYIAVSAVP